jgi:hypothetical protein
MVCLGSYMSAVDNLAFVAKRLERVFGGTVFFLERSMLLGALLARHRRSRRRLISKSGNVYQEFQVFGKI